MLSHVCSIDVPLPTDLPLPCTIRYLATHYLDIQCVPRGYFFELLMNFTKSEIEKEKLAEFCSADGQVSIPYSGKVWRVYSF